jgi:hypothetical protein
MDMANNNNGNGTNGNKNGFPWDYVLIGLGLGGLIWLILRVGGINAKYGLGQNLEFSPRKWAADFRVGGEIDFPQESKLQSQQQPYHRQRKRHYDYDYYNDDTTRRITIS